MGWDSNSNWKTKADVVASQLAMYRSSTTYQVLDFKSTKSGLWIVVGNIETGKTSIVFDLIEKQYGSYSVKGVDESMGPYYYDCPAKFLDMVSPDIAYGFNTQWRSRWKLYNKHNPNSPGLQGVP